MVFDFINYRFILITGMVFPPKPVSRFSDVAFRNSGAIKGGAWKIGGLIDGAKFVGSWIEFDADAPATLINVQFDHCVLVFRGFNTESPPPMFRAIAKQLLESSIADATITAKSS
jgi:hypothetical protein